MDISNYSIQQIIEVGSGTIEIFVFLMMVLYLFFAFILIRKLRIMNLNFKTPYNKLFLLLARAHFVASFIVIILTFITIRR